MNDTKSKSPNPTIAMAWFSLITTMYFIVRVLQPTKIPDKGSKSNQKSNLLFGIYLLFLIIGELIINIELTKTMCGVEQPLTAFIVTLIPWVIIFGILNIMLIMFPGWLSPFSNTFGYGVAKLSGISKTMNKIFKAQVADQSGLSGEMKSVQEALANIYKDKSLLINEITTENFETFWNKMSVLFRPNVKGDTALKNELFKHVLTKQLTAEYIWYILTGGLVTSASYNFLVNSRCKISTSEQERRAKEYENSQKKKNETKPANKVYTTYE
tara:strand:- start:22 stop:831 length:810 start_codon:yes stop_codon:yes gene_type:complete